MKKTDIQCPDCAAGYRRIELISKRGKADVYRCQVCNRALETFDGTTEIAYRLTVVPEKMFE
jgi:transposase-like protein